MNSCCISHELRFVINHTMEIMNPISPIRLYKIACRAAVFASDRLSHHPISRKDIIPTPSQPMKSCIALFAVTRIIMVMRNRRRYLMNLFMSGSECIYHIENSMIDHVTNSATDINVTEK